LALISDSSSSVFQVISKLSKKYSQKLATSSIPIIFIKVDFQLQLGPIIETKSQDLISKSTHFKTSILFFQRVYVFLIFLSVIMVCFFNIYLILIAHHHHHHHHIQAQVGNKVVLV